MSKTYLFTVGPSTPPAMTIDPGAEIEVTVDGAFDDIEDIAQVPTPFTPASEGHPLAPVTGPIAVRGARPGDSVAIDLLSIEPFGEGANAILRDFGVLKEEFTEPAIVSCPIRDGQAWFGDRVAIPLAPNLGTLSTMPPEGYRPSHAGPYGGDFDQRDVGVGARVHLPVMVDDALIFMADPHAAISDGIISGTGVECSARVRARIALNKESPVERPIIEHNGTVQIVGLWPFGGGGDRRRLCRRRRSCLALDRAHAARGLHAARHRRRVAHRHLAPAHHGCAADRGQSGARLGGLGRRRGA